MQIKSSELCMDCHWSTFCLGRDYNLYDLDSFYFLEECCCVVADSQKVTSKEVACLTSRLPLLTSLVIGRGCLPSGIS